MKIGDKVLVNHPNFQPPFTGVIYNENKLSLCDQYYNVSGDDGRDFVGCPACFVMSATDSRVFALLNPKMGQLEFAEVA